MRTLYKNYFNIDPKYYASVTADLIKSGKVKWTSFYPHETFVKLLEKVHIMLSGKDSRSLWVEGAYGTGKSHAALTVKSLLEASDEEIRAYFKDYGLREDLCQQLITDKSSGRLLTVHRISSASIRSDKDLIWAVQSSIVAALREHGIANRGEGSLKDAFLRWLEEKEYNKTYFNSIIQEEDDENYSWDFGGRTADEIIDTLKNSADENVVAQLMRSIVRVAENNNLSVVRMDIQGLCDWIKNIIDVNNLSAILFVWDEFTEYFQNNQNALTGFQTLAEISESKPFYFLIVTHQSNALIGDSDMRKKILNRFVGDRTISIELPDNMAFRLLAQAMKTTNDPVLLAQWQELKPDLNNALAQARQIILASARKNTALGAKTLLTDEDLQAIVPIHPYAALLLKHMSVAFNSNARSMFDFVISNDMTEARSFKWFINEHGALDMNYNLLTVDMLWDFFTGKEQNGLNDDVRVVLDAYRVVKQGTLDEDEQRVFKTVLLLQAISLRVGDVELLRPTEQNIELAFSGMDWQEGQARRIAERLCEKRALFTKSAGSGVKEYMAASRDFDADKLKQLREDVIADTRTQNLLVSANLLETVQLPLPIRSRFVLRDACAKNLKNVAAKLRGENRPHRFKTVVVFSLKDEEAQAASGSIAKDVKEPENELFYIESLTPMGDDLFTQYVENMAQCRNYAKSDRQFAKKYEGLAIGCLETWKQRIAAGAFKLYTPNNVNGMRVPNLEALNDALLGINHSKYPCGLEQFRLTDAMFMSSTMGQGAEYGITGELKGAFKSSNANTSLATALAGAWQVERYWEDTAKKALPIVRIKQEAERVIRAGFEHASGRVSISSIFAALEEEPFGFMPSNVAAFVLGFVLKEYVTSDYFWSNGSVSESMTMEKMKLMIANVLKHKAAPTPKYKEEYIVAMSPDQRAFLECTANVFHIPQKQCGSVESARDQVRIKMKGLAFPIWCLKYILNEAALTAPKEKLAEVIDAYCGIANTANVAKATESELAERIGASVRADAAVAQDLAKLLTDDMCRRGMLAYIGVYREGELKKLAEAVGDGGAYLDQVKQKFNADAANWVWNMETANEKIADVILEYRIIAESNKGFFKCSSLREVVAEWSRCCENIRMPYEALRKTAGALEDFLHQLYYIKQSGRLQEQYKKDFYNALTSQREAFEKFYRDQLPVFKEVAGAFLEGLGEEDVFKLYNDIAAGQFTKSGTEYYKYIEKKVTEYKKSILKTQLNNLWLTKTGTKNPKDWSEKYATPLLCMFDDEERGAAKAVFATMLAYSAPDADITKALEYLEQADFYGRLRDAQERDRCFKERVIGDYAVMLQDVDAVRGSLSASLSFGAYEWMDNSVVQNRLKVLAEKQYKLSGCDRAQAVISKMDATELRRYLNELIADNITVGMEILKNE